MVPLALRPCRSTRRFAVAFWLFSTLTLAGCTPEVPVGAAGGPIAREHVVAGPLQGRTGAFLLVGDAVSRMQVVLATMPGLLYRISTPPGSGLAPRVSSRDGQVRARFRPTGADGPDEVRIVLNREVRWDIRLPAGAGEQQLDLAGGRVRRVALGACGLAELRLPKPVGTVSVIFDGGVGTAVLTTPADIALHVHLARGADAVDAPWPPGDAVATPNAPADGAVAAGTVLEAPGWGAARDRYTVLVRAGLGSLVLRRSGPAAR